MKRISVLLIFVSTVLFSVGAQESKDASRYDDIRTLLAVSGSGEMGMMVVDSLSVQFQQIFPDIPVDYWNIFREEISAEELEELVAPIYDRFFTHEDIQDLIDFYNSPLGQKLVEVQPVITQESMIVGQVWGEEIAQRVLLRMEQDGYYQQQ